MAIRVDSAHVDVNIDPNATRECFVKRMYSCVYSPPSAPTHVYLKPMSTEPAGTPAPSSGNDKGKGKALESTEGESNGSQAANGGDQAGGLTAGKDGKGLATAPEDKENVTPEALREQLEAVRRELRLNLEKKQGIDRQLVSSAASQRQDRKLTRYISGIT